jgi:23S rRNA (cytidine1920-2'-O)/16S rRNA (cytidine1409-2'-O)-methyltransferase
MQKIRLDIFLVENGLVESRNLAQRMIMAGEVRVNGTVIDKPSSMVIEDDKVEIDPLPRYASRGGEKLEKALLSFNLTDLSGKVCVDVGSSTGGFTDCLLQHGASRVYAIDVGKGLLHWKLRNDTRVILMEQTNARYVLGLPEKIALVTIDASFISLKTLLPVIKKWLDSSGRIIALIKPQFEAGRELSAKGKGVIRDPAIHNEILKDLINFSLKNEFEPLDLVASPILGPKGNREFLLYMQNSQTGDKKVEEIIEKLIIHNNGL